MIDPRIKNRAIGVIVLVVALPLLSTLWNRWMEATQQEMIDNQAKMRAHARGLVQQAQEARMATAIRERCDAVLLSDACLVPRSMSQVEDCLYGLSMHQCGSLPDVHLCSAVEQIKICADPFEDQRRNGCESLRRTADCEHDPAPKNRGGLWRIDFSPSRVD